MSRFWFALTVALPLAGIALLLLTHLSGRSALMGHGLVISLLLLTRRDLRALAYLGIGANALLLTGDLATGDATAPLVAVLIAAGYVLLFAWFALLAVRLLGSTSGASPEAPRAA